MYSEKYAVIKTGGKQYRVKKGQIIDVELLYNEDGSPVDSGSAISFAEVLFVGDEASTHVGNPSVAGYIVQGEILGEAAGPKIHSIKYVPRQNEVRKFGHRQRYTRVKITEIAKV